MPDSVLVGSRWVPIWAPLHQPGLLGQVHKPCWGREDQSQWGEGLKAPRPLSLDFFVSAMPLSGGWGAAGGVA